MRFFRMTIRVDSEQMKEKHIIFLIRITLIIKWANRVAIAKVVFVSNFCDIVVCLLAFNYLVAKRTKYLYN